MKNKNIGSRFDDFLKETVDYEEVSKAAKKKVEQYKLEKQSEKRLLEFLDLVIDQVRKAKTDYAAGRDLTGNFKQMELELAGMANEITERKGE